MTRFSLLCSSHLCLVLFAGWLAAPGIARAQPEAPPEESPPPVFADEPPPADEAEGVPVVEQSPAQQPMQPAQSPAQAQPMQPQRQPQRQPMQQPVQAYDQEAPPGTEYTTADVPTGENDRTYSVIGAEVGYGATVAGSIPVNPYGISLGLFIQQRMDTAWLFSFRGGLTIGPEGPGELGERYDYFTFNFFADFGYEFLLGDVFGVRPTLGLGVEFLGGGRTDSIDGLKLAAAFMMQPGLELMIVTPGHFQIGVRGGFRVAFHNRPENRPEVRFPTSVQASVVVGWRM